MRAVVALAPTMGGAVITHAFSARIHGEPDLLALHQHLMSQCDSIRGGDLKRAESMLIVQAHSLDAIFTNLARRASWNLGEHLDAAETYLKLALKAQSQCRATLETLATIKNPPIFARQANIAHGPQQVNNEAPSAVTPAQKIEHRPNELLEHDHGERLDTRTASKAGRGDQAVATVGAIHRPVHAKRQSKRQP